MSSTLNLKFCPNCGERLSYTSFEGYCAFADCLWNNEECTSPGHQDQGARLAASAQVDQVGGTPTLEQFERWLDDRMISLSSEAANPCTTKSDAAELQAESNRTVTSLLHVHEFMRSFKLEQGK